MWRQWWLNKWVWGISGMMTGETEVIGRLVPMPLWPPQIPHGLAWDWIRQFAVRGHRLSHSTPTPYQCILRKRKVHCRDHKSPIAGPYPEQINLVHDRPSYFFRIYLTEFFRLHLGLQSGPFPPGFPTKTLYSFLRMHSVRSFNTRTTLCPRNCP